MSCTHLQSDPKAYNACMAQATAFAQSERTASRQAQEAYAAQQANIAAQYAAGGALRDLSVGPDYQHASIAQFLPKTASNVQAGAGGGLNKGLLIAGILGGGLVFMGIIFAMMRTKPPRRGYRGYRP